MNTRFHYIYRDASNYKQGNSVVLAGRLTEEVLKPFLDDGQFFIASQVGLENLQPQMISFPDEDDHVYSEFTFVEETADDPTVEFTAGELLARFKSASEAGWDEAAAMEELGL